MCEHKKFHTIKDVGWDISEDGEELQHIDRCEDCKAWRFRIWMHCYDRPSYTYLGEWQMDTWPQENFII